MAFLAIERCVALESKDMHGLFHVMIGESAVLNQELTKLEPVLRYSSKYDEKEKQGEQDDKYLSIRMQYDDMYTVMQGHGDASFVIELMNKNVVQLKQRQSFDVKVKQISTLQTATARKSWLQSYNANGIATVACVAYLALSLIYMRLRYRTRFPMIPTVRSKEYYFCNLHVSNSC